MSSKPVTLVRWFLILLLVLLAPALTHGQEQAAAPPEKQQAPEAVQQQQPAAAPAPASAVTPTGAKETPEAPEAAATAPAQESATYTIKKGDTLWDISNALLKDPFLWPFIWKANPSITNADLIYPGNNLIIPSMAPVERAMEAPPVEQPAKETAAAQPAPAAAPEAAPAEAAQKPAAEEPAVKSTLIMPEEKPVPVMDKYSMLSAGFVNREESMGRITGSVEGKTIMGDGDIVYVAIDPKKTADVGDRFIIFKELDTVRHPVTGRKYGRLIKVLGVLQLTEKGEKNFYNGRIILSFDAAAKGDLLTPYQEPTLFYKTAEPKQKDLTGYILQVVDGRTVNAQTDIVYLDKGSNEGVELGDRFTVYAKDSKKMYPKRVVGEVQVFLVKENTATAVIRKSLDTVVRGDMIEYKK
jgi:hypothetical protein